MDTVSKCYVDFEFVHSGDILNKNSSNGTELYMDNSETRAVEEEGDTSGVFFKIKSVEDYSKFVSSVLPRVDTAVVNLSDANLTEHQISLLSKGLNFCPTPGAADMGELRRDLDSFHRKLKFKAHFHKGDESKLPPKPVGRPKKASSITGCDIRSLMSQPPAGTSTAPTPTENSTSNLRFPNRRMLVEMNCPFEDRKFTLPSNATPPNPAASVEALVMFDELELSKHSPKRPKRQNISREEKEALQQLREMHDIIIKPADKGSAVVIMNISDYVAEGDRQLADRNFYRPVGEDLTASHTWMVNETIDLMRDNGEISEKNAAFLRVTRPRTAQMYLLPKIHKNQLPPPGRPIISANECPTERISQFVDHFLQPFLTEINTFLRDSADFINELGKLGIIPKGSILFVADVVSLYTNIPHIEAIICVLAFLRKHRPSAKHPTNESLAKLLEFILKLNNFQFNGENYLQVGGTAMGTKVAPSLANVFMSDLEDRMLDAYPLKCLFFKRFIDDCFGIWTHGKEEFDKWVKYLNDSHPSIKFTVETSASSVAFLDVQVNLDDQGRIWTDLYTKPTDSHNYLHYSSAHPPHCKKALPYSQFLRIRRICSRESDFIQHCLELKFHLLRRGYPCDTLDEAFRRASAISLEDARKIRLKEDEEDLLFLTTTYIPEDDILRTIVDRNWEILEMSSSTRELAEKRPIYGYRRAPNL